MPLIRKRRAQPDEEASPPASPPSTQRRNTQRRRRRAESEENDAVSTESSAGEADTQLNGTQTQETGDGGTRDQMVKKMVRLALACEYARQPIRRGDIGVKVLGTHGGRQFKYVFEEAQKELREKFGMEMTELPVKEKVTISQRRAAQRTEKQVTTTKTWILTTTLPPKYHKDPAILSPPLVPTSNAESTYVAIYTFIHTLLALSPGGSVPETKLSRYLHRMNLSTSTPLGTTEKLLQRLVKDGYIIRYKDNSGGEEVVEYIVGPRAKMEIGDEGVRGLVRGVYGKVDAEAEELERAIDKSLAIDESARKKAREGAQQDRENGAGSVRKGVGRPRRRGGGGGDDDEDEDSS